MKKILILLSLVLCSGCSDYRTSKNSQIQPVEMKCSKAIAFRLCKDAARDYFSRIDRSSLEEGYIFINNNNFWAGDTDVNILLNEIEGGKIRVDVSSHGSGFNQPLYNRSENDAKGFYKALYLRIYEYNDQESK